MKIIKRVIASLIAGVLLCTGTALSTASAETNDVFGDIDKDGIVNTHDAMLVLYYYNGTILENEDVYSDIFAKYNVSIEDILAADLNSDGFVDCNDAIYMLKYFAISILNPDATPEEIWEEALRYNSEDSYPDGFEKGDVM